MSGSRGWPALLGREHSAQFTLGERITRGRDDLEPVVLRQEERHLTRLEDVGERRHDDREEHVERLVRDEKV